MCVACESDARIVYRNLCVQCYCSHQISCDACSAMLGAETHQQNDGLCFDCFLPACTTVDAANRDEHLARVKDLYPFATDGYMKFLGSHEGRQRYTHRSMRGKAWRLASCVPEHQFHLFETININGETEAFHRILSLYSRLDAANASASIRRYGVDRLSAGFAIGEENSDILFFDNTDNMSLWCYHHDGEVERVCKSFDEWISAARSFYKPIKTTSKLLQSSMTQYVGRWKPATKPKKPNPNMPKKEYVFCEDSRARCIYRSRELRREEGQAPKIVDRTSESFGVWRLFGKDKLEFQASDSHRKFIRLPDGSIRGDNNPDSDLTYQRSSSECS